MSNHAMQNPPLADLQQLNNGLLVSDLDVVIYDVLARAQSLAFTLHCIHSIYIEDVNMIEAPNAC